MAAAASQLPSTRWVRASHASAQREIRIEPPRYSVGAADSKFTSAVSTLSSRSASQPAPIWTRCFWAFSAACSKAR